MSLGLADALVTQVAEFTLRKRHADMSVGYKPLRPLPAAAREPRRHARGVQTWLPTILFHMRISITGATGFIGSHLAAHLVSHGYTVRALTRGGKALPDGVAEVVGDLTSASPDALAAFVEGADALVHAAGEIQDEGRMEHLHVHATQRLAEAASGRIGRWVQLSSTGVYGPQRTGIVTEDALPKPMGAYEVTKAASDEIVTGSAARGAFEAVVLRPAIVFGEGMPNDSVRQLVSMIRRGLFAFVGAPGASANYVHVADVVEALVRCVEYPGAAGRVYNLSDWATMEDFAAALADGAGVAAPTRRLPEPLVRIAARLGDRTARLPLTTARVDALTGRARYSTERIERELSFYPHSPLPVAASRAAAFWTTQ